MKIVKMLAILLLAGVLTTLAEDLTTAAIHPEETNR